MATASKIISDRYITDYTKQFNEEASRIAGIIRNQAPSGVSKVYAPNTKSIDDLTKQALSIYQLSSDNPEADYVIDSLIANALKISDVSSVSSNRGKYWQMFGITDSKSLWQAMSDSFKLNSVQRKISSKASKLTSKSLSEAERNIIIQEIDDLEAEAAKLTDTEKRGVVGSALVSTANMMPDAIRSSLVAGALTAVGGGALYLGGKLTTESATAINILSQITSKTKTATYLGTTAYTIVDTFTREKGSLVNELRKITDSNGNRIDVTDDSVSFKINAAAVGKAMIEALPFDALESSLLKGVIKPAQSAAKRTLSRSIFNWAS